MAIGSTSFPGALDDNTSLYDAKNLARTTLTASATSTDTSLSVADTSGFPSSGSLLIDNEYHHYTGKTSTTFTGVSGAQEGTSLTAHANGATVEQVMSAQQRNVLRDAIVATETKLGSGASTPTSGTVLTGTGTGTSAWQALAAGPTGPTGPSGARGATGPTGKTLLATVLSTNATAPSYVVGNWTITDAIAHNFNTYVGTRDALIDINKNGTSIFASDADRINIAANTRYKRTTTFATTALTVDDYLTVDIDQSATITTTSLLGICYGSSDDLFVAVGTGGVIATSPDGMTWTARTSGTTSSLLSVCYGAADDLFVAVGSVGTILTSPDGVTWTSRTSGTGNQLSSVCYGAADDLFVAVGLNGATLTSPDGVTWTSRSNGSAIMNAVCYGAADDLFVSVGNAGTIRTSPDGVTWTARTSGVTNNLLGVCYGAADDLFVAVGSSGTILTSPDGVTWTARTSAATQLNAVCYGASDDLFVAVGNFSGTNTLIVTSPDGVTWTSRSNTYPNTAQCICYGDSDDLFVAGGSAGQFLRSSDGVNWTITGGSTIVVQVFGVPA